MNARGNATAVRARAIVTRAVFQRLAQRLQRVAAELGQLVEEQHAVVRERDLARPWRRPPPTSAAA